MHAACNSFVHVNMLLLGIICASIIIVRRQFSLLLSVANFILYVTGPGAGSLVLCGLFSVVGVWSCVALALASAGISLDFSNVSWNRGRRRGGTGTDGSVLESESLQNDV